MRIVTLPGVFRPRSDSWLLAAAVTQRADLAGARVLDLCTGSGVVAVSAALAGAREVVAVDVSRRAVLTARINAVLHGVRVQVRRGSLFDAAPRGRYDIVIANPPYVPSPDPGLPRRGARRAWDAGTDGRAVLDAIIDGAPARLEPGGLLLLTHSSIIGIDETLRRMGSVGLTGFVVAEHEGPLGPLMAGRRAHLAQQGLLDAGAAQSERVGILAGMR